MSAKVFIAPQQQQQQVQVQIPQGAVEGQVFAVAVNGAQVNVQVPAGATGGQIILVNVPAAAAAPMAMPVGGAPAMVAPGQQLMTTQTPIPTDLSILANTSKLIVRQKVKFGEALTQGCIEQSNTYEVYDAATSRPIMRAHERSGDCTRCCCAPDHSLRLEVNALAAGNPEMETGTVMTMERVGMCSKVVGCWSCCECCMDGANFHRGKVTGEPGGIPDQGTVFARAQPVEVLRNT